jgi:hypothetical protein
LQVLEHLVVHCGGRQVLEAGEWRRVANPIAMRTMWDGSKTILNYCCKTKAAIPFAVVTLVGFFVIIRLSVSLAQH